GANALDQVAAAGEQAETRPDSAVFVEPGGADIDAQLQHLRLVECGRPDPCPAGVVDIDERALVVRQPDHRVDRIQRHQIVGDREPRQYDQGRALDGDRV